jgi:hypothetical protein
LFLRLLYSPDGNSIGDRRQEAAGRAVPEITEEARAVATTAGAMDEDWPHRRESEADARLQRTVSRRLNFEEAIRRLLDNDPQVTELG